MSASYAAEDFESEELVLSQMPSKDPAEEKRRQADEPSWWMGHYQPETRDFYVSQLGSDGVTYCAESLLVSSTTWITSWDAMSSSLLFETTYFDEHGRDPPAHAQGQYPAPATEVRTRSGDSRRASLEGSPHVMADVRCFKTWSQHPL